MYHFRTDSSNWLCLTVAFFANSAPTRTDFKPFPGRETGIFLPWPSLVPMPLPDFASQLWPKFGRRPGIITMSRTENGGLFFFSSVFLFFFIIPSII